MDTEYVNYTLLSIISEQRGVLESGHRRNARQALRFQNMKA